MVYRRASPTSNDYSAVNGSAWEKTVQWSDIRDSQFQCMQENLNPNHYVEIQENDIVGACIKNDGPVEPLLLVGTKTNAMTNTYRLRGSSYDDCSLSDYNTVDTGSSRFEPRGTSILHLHANISNNNQYK